MNWDWFDLIRDIYQSVSCPKFCCHSCTNLIKVAWIRVGKINKHEVYHMEELRKSKKLHEFLKFSNQVKKTQNQLKQIEYWSGFFFLPTKPCLAPSESSGIMLDCLGTPTSYSPLPKNWNCFYIHKKILCIYNYVLIWKPLNLPWILRFLIIKRWSEAELFSVFENHVDTAIKKILHLQSI